MTESDDAIVEELDVYFCTKDALGAQLYMLQHPLRPAWTPYDTENAEKIQFKPESKKLEIEVSADEMRSHMDADEEKKPSADRLKLTATEVDPRTTFHAVGYKRGHALYLTEVEGVLQLKPDLDHHDPAPSEKLEEKPKEELTQLQAKMRRRETPAEQQRRENSYAHMAKKERLEKWKPLKAIGSTSRITDKVLEQLTTPVDTDVEVLLDKDAFLSSIAPPRLQQEALEQKPIAESKPRPKELEIDVALRVLDSSRIGDCVQDAILEQLSAALEGLFATDGVANLRDVRHCLRTFQGGCLRDLAILQDDVLHDAILRSKNVTCIRRVYLRLATGSTQLDPLRTILMGIVRNKETIKRNDVVSAAKAKGIKITEKLFDTIMREICVSKDGGFWTLKTGRIERHV